MGCDEVQTRARRASDKLLHVCQQLALPRFFSIWKTIVWAPQGFFPYGKNCRCFGSGLRCCDAPKVLVARLKVSHTHTHTPHTLQPPNHLSASCWHTCKSLSEVRRARVCASSQVMFGCISYYRALWISQIPQRG